MKKTTAVIAAVLLSASLTRANLIDLTPGGFDLSGPLPQPVLQFFRGPIANLLAGGNVENGSFVWSPFTPFGPGNFSVNLNAALTGADVGWNLNGTGTPPFFGTYVFVESSELVANLYRIPAAQRFEGEGSVEINGVIHPIGITFFGKNSIPDTGSTLLMLGCAVGAIVLLRRRICT
jgi:protein with PEP-CTERM/exosortase system signal